MKLTLPPNQVRLQVVNDESVYRDDKNVCIKLFVLTNLIDMLWEWSNNLRLKNLEEKRI